MGLAMNMLVKWGMGGMKHGDWISASSISEPRTNVKTKR